MRSSVRLPTAALCALLLPFVYGQQYDFAAEFTRQCLVPDPVGLLDCVVKKVTLPYLASWTECTNSLGENVKTLTEIINHRCKTIWEGKGIMPEVFYIRDCVIEKIGLPAKNVSTEILGAYNECEKLPSKESSSQAKGKSAPENRISHKREPETKFYGGSKQGIQQTIHPPSTRQYFMIYPVAATPPPQGQYVVVYPVSVASSVQQGNPQSSFQQQQNIHTPQQYVEHLGGAQRQNVAQEYTSQQQVAPLQQQQYAQQGVVSMSEQQFGQAYNVPQQQQQIFEQYSVQQVAPQQQQYVQSLLQSPVPQQTYIQQQPVKQVNVKQETVLQQHQYVPVQQVKKQEQLIQQQPVFQQFAQQTDFEQEQKFAESYEQQYAKRQVSQKGKKEVQSISQPYIQQKSESSSLGIIPQYNYQNSSYKSSIVYEMPPVGVYSYSFSTSHPVRKTQ